MTKKISTKIPIDSDALIHQEQSKILRRGDQDTSTINMEFDELPNYDRKFLPIKEYITSANPIEEWEELKAWIEKIPFTISDTEEMMNEQPNMSIKAHRLALMAKQEFLKYELEWKEKTSILREESRIYWESRKQQGMHKQITNDMINDRIADLHPEIWNELNERLISIKSIVTLTEKLAERIEERGADLRRKYQRHIGHGAMPKMFTPSKHEHSLSDPLKRRKVKNNE